jgi:hypothetical protein
VGRQLSVYDVVGEVKPINGTDALEKMGSPRRGSNSRPFAYEANALPLCYGGLAYFGSVMVGFDFVVCWGRVTHNEISRRNSNVSVRAAKVQRLHPSTFSTVAVISAYARTLTLLPSKTSNSRLPPFLPQGHSKSHSSNRHLSNVLLHSKHQRYAHAISVTFTT